jgi:integrase
MNPASRAPRSRRKPPAYCKHKASGLAYVKIRGHRHYLGPHGTPESRAEYRRKIAELWAKPPEAPEAIDLTPAQIDRLTIIDLGTEYRKHAEQEYRRDGKPTATLANIKPALRRLRERYGEQLARDFGPLKLKALRQTWVDEGLARKTVNEYTAAVRRAFYWAVENELLPGDRGYALWKVKPLGKGKARDTAPIAPVSDETVDATLPHLPPMVADMVRFQRLTGCRPGEVCAITREEVRRLAQAQRGKKSRTRAQSLFPELPLPAAELEVWEFHPKQHKMSHKGRPRVVMIGPKARDILRPYLAAAGDGRCFPYTPAAYRRAIARACERAFKMPEGLRQFPGKLSPAEVAKLRAEARAWRDEHVWHPNQLRHSTATEIRARFGLEGSQVVLGHQHASTTEIYAEKDLAKARAIALEVG